jgi:HK97 family phage prohead protease
MVKAFALELKQLTDSGTFTGLASVYGVEDLTGDVVEAGAFNRTLADSGAERPLLWQHQSPIGVVRLADSPTGLLAEGRLSMGLQLAKDALVLLKDGVVRGLSIGFQSVREEFKGDIRRLLEIRLWEISLVTFPALPEAQVLSVKSLQAQGNEIRRAAEDLARFYAGLKK